MKNKLQNFRREMTPGWLLLLTAIMAVWLIPLFYMVSMSFRTQDNIFAPTLFVNEMTLKNYVTVLTQNPTLPLNFLSSFVITVASVVLVTLFASMAVFGLSRKNVHGKSIIYNLLMSTLMVPISALVIPLTQISSKLSWLNTYKGLILPYTALGIPFAMVILKGFMDEFPIELEEAAMIDGCGTVRLFSMIVVPLLRPGIIVIVIWQFLTSWNEFFLALVIMNKKETMTLPLIAQQYQGMYFSQPGALFATLVMITIPMIIFYICVQKQFVKGLVSGAVKG